MVTALGTPLDRYEDLHEEGMRKQIRMQLAAGVDGLLVLGSMGCMQMLKDEVFVEAVEVAIDEVRGAVPVIVGCGDTSTERTLARIRLAENYPLTGVALIPPVSSSVSARPSSTTTSPAWPPRPASRSIRTTTRGSRAIRWNSNWSGSWPSTPISWG